MRNVFLFLRDVIILILDFALLKGERNFTLKFLFFVNCIVLYMLFFFCFLGFKSRGGLKLVYE